MISPIVRAVLLSFLSLTYAKPRPSPSENLQKLVYAQARQIQDILWGRQVTDHPCAYVPAPATCASSCGPGYIICPGGSSGDCYNPATEVCCGDGTTCPAGTTCDSTSLTCDPGSSSSSSGSVAAGTTYSSTGVATSSSAAATSSAGSSADTCVSQFGAGFVVCPGGAGNDCYNPATQVCCDDGTSCPVGTTCNSVGTCDPGTGAGSSLTTSYSTMSFASTAAVVSTSSPKTGHQTIASSTTNIVGFGTASTVSQQTTGGSTVQTVTAASANRIAHLEELSGLVYTVVLMAVMASLLVF